MDPERGQKDRLLTVAIVVLSVAGIAYFGIRAVIDQQRSDRPNPYALDMTVFEEGPSGAPSYIEAQSIPLAWDSPTGLAHGPGGALYVSSAGRVCTYGRDGRFVDQFATDGTAHCLTIDRRGRIYAGMSDHVQVYDRGGGLIRRWESLGPRSIVTSVAPSDSAVYVADAGQLLVWKFSLSGSLLATYGSKDASKDVPGFVIPSPYFDVDIDPDGQLWAANTGRHSLENYADDGPIARSWGEYGTGLEQFCGCCNPSHFAILSDGGFVTSEKGVARVKTYDRQGRFRALVAGPDHFTEGVEGLDLAVDESDRIYVLDPARKTVRVFARDDASKEGSP